MAPTVTWHKLLVYSAIVLFYFSFENCKRWSCTSLWHALVKMAPIMMLAVAFVGIPFLPKSGPPAAANDLEMQSRRRDNHAYRKWIFCGLLASAIGDAFLVWPAYLLGGVISFGVAHTCYITAFGLNPFGSKMVATGFGVFYATALSVIGSVLYGHPTIKMAIVCYATLICTMAWRASTRFNDRRTVANLFGCIGALTFVVSDSLDGLEKANGPYFLSDYSIMITYYMAQLFVAQSADIGN